MTISPAEITSSPQVDFASLRAQATVNPEEAARAFEAVFASLLMKEMRNTLSEGLFGAEKSDVLGGLFDQHIGESLTEGRGIGIKQMVLAHLERTGGLTDSFKDE